jgi:hypothetical protein
MESFLLKKQNFIKKKERKKINKYDRDDEYEVKSLR